MVWPFKRQPAASTVGRPEADNTKAVVAKMEEAVRDFAKTVETQDDPMAFYDTSRLPHSKELIQRSLVFVIKFTRSRNPQYAEFAKVMLDVLPQYQENVGIEPVRMMPSMEGLSLQQLAAVITAHEANGEKARWVAFNKLADAEREANARALT